MLEIQLLGQFSVRRDDQLIEIGSRPAQSLLAYLVLNPNVAHRRERLAGLLWPDSSDANARRNLRQTLWQIRRALNLAASGSTGLEDAHPAGEHIDSTKSDASASDASASDASASDASASDAATLIAADDLTIMFNRPADFSLDTALIAQELDARASADDLIGMLNAYGGELLPGFYDDWVVLERERAYMQFERKMSALLDRLIEARRWDEVLHWGERWIVLGGTPEPAYRALMIAYAALGDAAKGAETYRRCAEALQRELGVEPSQQTQALYEHLRAGERGRAWDAPQAQLARSPKRRHNLPVHLTSFVGREKEMAELKTRLNATRLLTLTGAGGTGKTRLALQIAGQSLDSFPDGVWFIELAALSDPDLIPQTVAAVVDVREQPSQPLTRSLIESFHIQTLLLILDNCEHVVEACATFTEAVLRACPNLKVLATSRETLGVTGESIFRVPSLTLPDVHARRLPLPDDLMRYESIKLFVDRVSAVRPEFRLTEANAPAVTQICAQLDGMPLAIELAAARMRAMTVEQVAARLDDRFRLLTGGSRTALPRQQTLRALIDWSWDLLPDAERALLRRLSVFVEGWALEAAEWICDWPAPMSASAPAMTSGTTLDTLTRLVEKSLVMAEERGAETRYLLLETIRQYARDKLLDWGEMDAIRTRHLQYYRQLSEEAEPKLRAADQVIWLSRLEAEHGNVRAALKWAASSAQVEAGLRLAGNLARFWYTRGYWNEGREWLRLMLLQRSPQVAVGETTRDSLDQALIAARVNALCGAGWLADEDGSEIALYAEALALSQQVQDVWHAAFALRGMSSSTNVNDPEQAQIQLQQSLGLFRSLGDGWGTALALYNLGWRTFYVDDIAQAKSHWHEGLELFRRSGDRWGMAVTLTALGYVARTDGNYLHAAELTQESLGLFRALGDKAGIAISLDRLGNVALRRGDFVEAASLLREGLAIPRESGNRAGICSLLDLSGLVARYLGNYDQAEADLQEGLAIAREFDMRADIPFFLDYLGLVAYDQGDFARASSRFNETIAAQIESKNSLVAGIALDGLGMIALRHADRAAAFERLNESLTLFESIGDKRYIAMALQDLGELARQSSDRATDSAHMRASLTLRRQIGDKHGLAQSFEGIAALLSDASRAMQATHLLGAAQALRQTIGAPVPPVERGDLDQRVNSLRTELGAQGFESTWDAGKALTVERVVRQALDGLESLGV